MNNDYKQRVSIDSQKLNWEEDRTLNIFKKVLSQSDTKQTALIKIDKNSTLSNSNKINSVEIYVLEGKYTNEFGTYPQGTYLKLPKEQESLVSSPDSCTIYCKANYYETHEQSIVDTKNTSWSAGYGNLQVMGLSDQTALVKWPKDERFIPHSHWGGEEILVLSGVFMDEFGKYEVGNWTRSPHQSKHFPYVEDETVILVKTGHLF